MKMTNVNRILFAAAVAATLGMANRANAQYRPTGDDGITASPRVRQMLNEKAAAKRVAPVTPSVTVSYRNPAEGVTASPRVRQMLAERTVVVNGTLSTGLGSAGYRPAGADGITASPKLRQQLNQSGPAFMVAPVK